MVAPVISGFPNQPIEESSMKKREKKCTLAKQAKTSSLSSLSRIGLDPI